MASVGPSNHVSRVLSVANPLADTHAQSRIAESWRRCLIDHKLDPSRNGPPQTFTEPELRRFTQPIEQLIQAAIPELEDLARVLRDSGYCVNFADGSSVVSREAITSGCSVI